MDAKGRRTTEAHWNASWGAEIRHRLPSSLNVAVHNLKRLLRPRVGKGDRYIELGCAPGKMLAWVASELGAAVSGIDYSTRGFESAVGLFRALGIPEDIRCEDIAHNTFPEGSFDVVSSVGLVEHFDDPSAIIRQHVLLARPGGRIVIAVPNYGGILGRAQAWFDPANLAIHNLGIMTPETLREQLPADLVEDVRVFRFGRFSPWLVSIGNRIPAPVALGVQWALNFVSFLQPVTIGALAPLLVAEMRRKR